MLLLAAAGISAPAQVLSFGVKGGVPLKEAVRTYDYLPSWYANTGRWTVGPTAELHLGSHFSFEVDALLRAYTTGESMLWLLGDGYMPVFYSSRRKTKAWDFPFLLKYRIGRGTHRPFVTAGPQLSWESSDVESKYVCNGGNCYPPGYGLLNNGSVSWSLGRLGATFGGGMEFRLKRLCIAPELRVTRLIGPNSTQATALVGFTF
jgi:hypothetical protein